MSKTSAVSFEDVCQGIVNLSAASTEQEVLEAWYQTFELTCVSVIAFSEGYFDNFTDKGMEAVNHAFSTLAGILGVSQQKLLDIAHATE